MNRWNAGVFLFGVCALSAAGCGGADKPDLDENEATAESMEAVTNCTIAPEKELVITDLAVVGDTRATGMGPWSFGGLITAMAGDGDVQAFFKGFIESWLDNQVVAGQVIPKRTNMEPLVLAPWRARSAPGTYDLATAPMKLLAIVYRADLRRETNKGREAGEGRFVFGVMRPNGTVMPFTMILEFGLAVRQGRSAADWAALWHSLGTLPIGSREYNEKLEEITNLFASASAVAGNREGSDLNQLRTNEIALTFPPVPAGEAQSLWELREFHIEKGKLVPARVALTPTTSFDGTRLLGAYAGQHASSIEKGTHKVPADFRGTPFNGGSSLVPTSTFTWNVPGVSEGVRKQFSLNTCNGCHAGETETRFLHIGGNRDGGPAELSDFVARVEIPRRAEDLKSMLGCR